jgi:4-amino-4-deoxy-L-arabinose transferase-like glycosyltransferase
MILQESIRTKQPAVREIFTKPHASTTFQTVVKSKAAVFVLISFLLCILLFQGLGSPSIYILDEARNAQCAKEMEQNGTFIIPTFNGKLRTDKPPLHYFFMIAAYKMMGVSSFSARFFSAIFGLLTIGIIALFANKYIGQQTAVLTAIILSCSAQFIFEFRLAVPDPYFIFFTVAGMLSGFIWMKDNRVSFLYLSAILNGFGVLAKGPVAILLPAIAFLIFTFYKKSWKNFFSWHLVTAFLAFLVIALPWYLLVHQATGGQWTKSFF